MISRVADGWFVSLTVALGDVSMPRRENQTAAVGVDMGIKALATLSTGETVEGPKPHRALLLRRLNLKKLAVSSTVTACGEEGAGRIITDAVKPASMKQEPNTTKPRGIVVHV